MNQSLKFDKRTKIWDDSINSQRSPFIKIGLGFGEDQETTKEATSSKATNLQ